MKQNLIGISKTLLVPLWARKWKQNTPIPLLDKKVDMMEQIDYGFSKFNTGIMPQISFAMKTELLDKQQKL